jgi:hypothetical protein
VDVTPGGTITTTRRDDVPAIRARPTRRPLSGRRSGGAAAFLALPLLLACGEPLEPGAVTGAELTATGGCADAMLYAASDDGTHLLTVDWEGAATRAEEQNGLAEEVTLPDEQVQVRLQVGERLAERVCTDIVDPEWPEIEQRWAAVEGHATIEVATDPDPSEFPVASVTLTDLRLEPQEGEATQAWRLDRVEIEEVVIGWYAG